jgi:hypothetical protein
VASNERNKLVKQQHKLIHADSTLNTKGKKQQVYKDALEIYGDIREGLNRERHTMRALGKAKPGYNSGGLETMDMKQAVEQYKRVAQQKFGAVFSDDSNFFLRHCHFIVNSP